MTRSKAIGTMLATALLISALPAVTAAQDQLEVTPEGVNWSLTSYAVDGAATDVPPGVNASLFMDAGEASGNGGCNSFFGTYQLDGSSLSFAGEVGQTLAICEEPAQSVEDASVPLLGDVASWAIDGKLMSLSDVDGSVILTYEEPVIDVTETDVIALDTALAQLHARVEGVQGNLRNHQIPALRNQVEAIGAHVDALQAQLHKENTPGLRNRVIANEAVIESLQQRIINVRIRVRDLEKRVDALEQ